MKVIEPSYSFLGDIDGVAMLQKIEIAKRICYQSEDRITQDSYLASAADLIARGHEAMLEHASISVLFTIDRGVANEITRHRIASFAQSSTRYCNFSQDKFGNEITVIRPCFFRNGTVAYDEWYEACAVAEQKYFSLLRIGMKPEEARDVLPISTMTKLVMTANLREWRHFFKLRAVGTTGKPHPQMLQVTVPLLADFKKIIPVVFNDLVVDGGQKSN